MANPLIVYTDLSAITFSGSKGTDASYPLTNLADYDESTQWKSASTVADQFLQLDFGTATPVDTIVVGNHNFADLNATKIFIESSSNGTTWGDCGQIADVNSDPTNASLSTAGNTRYYRLRFNRGVPLSDVPTIGNLFIGTAVEFTTPYNWGYKTENAQYTTTEKVSLDGTLRTSQTFAGRIVYELKFTLQTDALKTSFQNFVKGVRGKMYPFYFVDTDGSTVRYMHLVEDYVPVVSDRYNLNSVTLNMRTHTAEY